MGPKTYVIRYYVNEAAYKTGCAGFVKTLWAIEITLLLGRKIVSRIPCFNFTIFKKSKN